MGIPEDPTMFNLIKLGVLSVMFPDTAKDLAASLVALLPEQYEPTKTGRIMIRGPRGPYYMEKKYLSEKQLVALGDRMTLTQAELGRLS